MGFDGKQLARIRKALDVRYSALLAEIRDEMEDSENLQYVELIGRSAADSGDAAVSDALADLNLDILDRHVRELRQLEAARARLDEDRFGACIDCGNDIAFERLLVHPPALRCRDCQQQRERTHAHPSGPKL